MEKEFVPYPLALRMKQLGFDEPCFAYYDYYTKGVPLEMYGLDHDGSGQPAPTYSQAFRWFREQKGMWVTFEYHDCDCVEADVCWYVGKCFIYGIGPLFLTNELGDFKTLEEAEAACLEVLIEIVEKKRKYD